MDSPDNQYQRTGQDHRARAVGAAPAAEVAEVTRPLRVLIPALIVVFVAALDLTVIAPVLPSIIFDLKVNTAEADRYVWIVSGYLLAYTVTIPLMGRLSDVIGRRATFMLALVVFLAGSVLAATADSLPRIIAARAVQGFGGGAMVPVAMAVVGDLLPPARRAGALGIVAAADTLGWVLGPLWGAGIMQLAGTWRWIFILNVPIGLAAGAALVVAWRRAPVGGRGSARFDLPGGILLAAALLCLNLAISVAGAQVGGGPRALGAEPNPLAAYRLPLLVAGLAALAGFVAVEWHVKHPLVPLQLFLSRHFSAANGANFLVGAALMVAMVNVPLLVALQVSEARVAPVSAELLSAFSLAMAVAALLGGWVSERRGYLMVTLLGLAVASAGFWRMSGWPNQLERARMLPDLAVTGFGFGLVIAPIGAAAIDAARRSDLGIASGLVIVMRLLGMTLGLSALTSWAVARLNDALTHLPPVTQKPGESLSSYLLRQQAEATKLAIPATMGVIRDTFAAAAVICLVALLPALLLYTRRTEGSRRAERST
ncbi:MAG TPA: MFS transporter [Thermomicrobiaceae bacterium]|nr:MFS transporter [Thermomicrobiaceae bacterium]